MSDTGTNDTKHDAEGTAGKAAADKPDAGGFGSTAIGILGFVIALGGGFFIGQWIRRPPAAPVEIVEGDRYSVRLRGDEPTRGPDDALVTVIEFADFQCPYCGKGAGPLEEVREEYDRDVRVIYKHYPLPFHRKAPAAARAAWAAHQQGKFWEIHDWLYEHKAELDGIDAEIERLDMDLEKFRVDSVSKAAIAAVEDDSLAGGLVGVSSTPAFVVNGHPYRGARGADVWEQIVKAELVAAKKLLDDGVPRSDVYAKLMEGALEKVPRGDGSEARPPEGDAAPAEAEAPEPAQTGAG